MDYNMIFEKFTLLSDMPSDEASKFSTLINDSISQISAILLPDTDNEDNCRRLTAAAASWAYYRYKQIICSRGEYDGIKAGDVTVNPSDRSMEAARAIYLDSMAAIADITTDRDFIFERVSAQCTQEQSTQ